MSGILYDGPSQLTIQALKDRIERLKAERENWKATCKTLNKICETKDAEIERLRRNYATSLGLNVAKDSVIERLQAELKECHLEAIHLQGALKAAGRE